MKNLHKYVSFQDDSFKITYESHGMIVREHMKIDRYNLMWNIIRNNLDHINLTLVYLRTKEETEITIQSRTKYTNIPNRLREVVNEKHN